MLCPMSMKAEWKRANNELASIAAPQARETEEYMAPKTQDLNKHPADCPSRKSALLLELPILSVSRINHSSFCINATKAEILSTSANIHMIMYNTISDNPKYLA